MNKKILFNEGLLLLVTLIWGLAFIFQDIGMHYVGPVTFSMARSIVGVIFLFPLGLINYLKKDVRGSFFNYHELIGGLILGLVTACAMAFQQLGIRHEGAGKSGFIASLYVIFVPIIGILFHKKTNFIVMISVMLAITGLYFVNINDSHFELGIGTIYLLISAIFYALQILFIDKFGPHSSTINLAIGQFLVAGIIQIPIALIREEITINNLVGGLPSILYCGIFSTGVAFSIQIYAQKNIPVSIATVIMSFEAVFALIFSMIILKSHYGILEFIGCLFLFLAILIVQFNYKKKIKA